MHRRFFLFIIFAALAGMYVAPGSSVTAAQRAPQHSAASGTGATAPLVSHRLAVQWNIAGRPAVKILVRRAGWYRIGQGDLVGAGLNPAVDPHNLQLWVGGKQQPMLVIAQGPEFNRPWFAIAFYGVGLDNLETDTNVYYLVAGSQPGRRIQTQARPSSRTGTPLPSFPYTVEVKERFYYLTTPLGGDAGNIFGHVLFQNPLVQTLRVQNLDTSTKQTSVPLEIGIQGISSTTHTIKVVVNDAEVGTIHFAQRQHADQTFEIPTSLVHPGPNTVTLLPPNDAQDLSEFDFARLTYQHLGRADANRMQFQALAGQAVTVGGFTTPRIRVLDITKPHATPQLAPLVKPDGSGYAVTVQPRGTGTRTLLAFADGEQGDTVERSVPSQLHSSANRADYVILAYHDFISSVQPLAKLRESQGMAVSVIDVDSVYNEFSYGIHDPQAIKDFLMYAQMHWKHAPHYVLLMGAGSYDPRNYRKHGFTDLVPVKLIDTTYLHTASDEWFVDFKGDHVPAMAIGRLPVRTVSQANTVIQKIVHYMPSTEARSALLVAGAPKPTDSFSFADAARNLASLISPSLAVQTVDRSALTSSSARQEVVDGINQGPLLVNYVGHGSTGIWDDQLFTPTSAGALHNGNRLPLFIMMTCLNGYFIDPDPAWTSLAEDLLNAPNGGAVAVWTSTGETVPEPQAQMNQAFYRLLFSQPSLTLGDLAVKASQAASDPDVKQTWVMLGDPTMKIR